MPWKENCVVELRNEFSIKWIAREQSMASLCREYNISRKTGYKWLRRFLEKGKVGMTDESRKPDSSPRSLDEDVVCRIVKIREAHPSWGSRKIQAVYSRKNGESPSESSIKRILEKAGMVKKRRIKKFHDIERISDRIEPQAPNDVWTVDFKGWWHSNPNCRCEPLTIMDLKSKFLLSLQMVESTKTETIKKEFDKVFEKYGLPKYIRSDNGSPFASAKAPCGLSGLSVWWIAQGIKLDRGRPGKPQDNGSHERMHRNIKLELQGIVRGDRDNVQPCFDVWREEYNNERPHEALGMKVPSDVYRKSPRIYENIDSLSYPEGFLLRRVSNNGLISVYTDKTLISTSLRGWDVGLKPISGSRMEVWIGEFHIGYLALETMAFESVQARRPE